MEPVLDYRETMRILRSEGFDAADIDEAIINRTVAGIILAGEDHTYLTADEVQALRDVLKNLTD